MLERRLLLKRKEKKLNSKEIWPKRESLELKCRPKLPKLKLISRLLDLPKRKLLMLPQRRLDSQLSKLLVKRRKSVLQQK